jgi:hypothetical protein
MQQVEGNGEGLMGTILWIAVVLVVVYTALRLFHDTSQRSNGTSR